MKDGAVLDRPLRVAVIGGGPSGACAAESLAKGGCEAFLIERKMDNCKVRCCSQALTCQCRGGGAAVSATARRMYGCWWCLGFSTSSGRTRSFFSRLGAAALSCRVSSAAPA